MTQNRVLLMQGPLNSDGIDPVLQFIYPDPTVRPKVWFKYNCESNIKYMSMAFRSKGFKICYSGWSEDRDWLETNRELFDYLVISDQSELRSQSIRNGIHLSNNKEKMYFAAQEGLTAISNNLGDDTLVLRIRSDLTINQELVLLEAERIPQGSNILLIEYLMTDRILTLPDFMLMGEVSILRQIYTDLFQRSRTNTSYHISSHVDHGIAYIKLKQAGVISSINCMSKACFDSTVWRGVPRYFEYIFPNEHNHHFFEGALHVPPGFDVDNIISNMPETIAGPEPK